MREVYEYMKTLLKDIISNNGATLTKAGDKVCLSKGWQVSKRDLLIIPVYKLRKYIIKNMLSSIDDGDCLGIWIDNKKAYIDLSVTIPTKKQAIKVGKQNKQLSIWGWKNSEVVWLNKKKA